MNKAAWKKRIKNACIEAGTYRPFFDDLINTLAGVLERRDECERQYAESGEGMTIERTNKAGFTTMVKNPTMVFYDDFCRTALNYNATGVINSITHLLTEGYAVLERDPKTDMPTLEAYFLPYVTYYYSAGELIREYRHKAPYPLLVPVIYRPDASRPFGHSRISRACMSIIESAVRTIKRSEISAEFYSYPQKYVTGLAHDSEQMDTWKVTMSAMLEFTKDAEGDHPILGQFQQQTMAPHMEQLKMFAALFAGETGLTLDDLGFVTSNPSSAESIKASHETLRLTARKAQSYFGTAFLNIGMVAACLRDNYAYNRSVFYRTKASWYPVFEPDYAALSQVGDGAIKINQAIPNFFDATSLSNMTGIDPAEGAGNVSGFNSGALQKNT